MHVHVCKHSGERGGPPRCKLVYAVQPCGWVEGRKQARANPCVLISSQRLTRDFHCLQTFHCIMLHAGIFPSLRARARAWVGG